MAEVSIKYFAIKITELLILRPFFTYFFFFFFFAYGICNSEVTNHLSSEKVSHCLT